MSEVEIVVQQGSGQRNYVCSHITPKQWATIIDLTRRLQYARSVRPIERHGMAVVIRNTGLWVLLDNQIMAMVRSHAPTSAQIRRVQLPA